jgi:hypothetical protein
VHEYVFAPRLENLHLDSLLGTYEYPFRHETAAYFEVNHCLLRRLHSTECFSRIPEVRRTFVYGS